MNSTPITIKKIMKLVIFSLLLVPLACLADTFIKIQELKNTFKGGAVDISPSEDGRYVFVKDLHQIYWLMSITRPLAFHKIFNDKPDSPIFDYRFLRGQWHNNHIIFFSDDKTEFYNVQSQKIDQRYPLILSSFSNSEIFWSEKHQRFIVGTKVFALDTDAEQNPEQPGHAGQRGLLMMENGNDYITAGFHDESIMHWTLPDGKLKKTWQLGSWYSSQNVSDIALVDNRLLVATNNGEIEERSIENGNVLWSASPCSSFFASDKPYFLLNGLSIDSSIHDKKLVFYQCDSLKAKYGFIEKQKNGWTLNKITLQSITNSYLEYVYYLDSLDKAIFGLYDGRILLYDLKNKNIDQMIVPKSAEGEGPTLFAYLKADKLLVIVNDDSVDIYQYQ